MIFLSYSHKDSSIVDDIEKKFNKLGLELKRDIRELNYDKKSIKEFMKQIRQSDYAIILVTKNYLKSPKCMFELYEFLKEQDYKNRIIPLIQESSNIFINNSKIA